MQIRLDSKRNSLSQVMIDHRSKYQDLKPLEMVLDPNVFLIIPRQLERLHDVNAVQDLYDIFLFARRSSRVGHASAQ